MEHLKLSFFGAFEATLGDKPLTNFRSAKVQGLLVYLALTYQQPQPRDGLAALFWADEPETIARQNLRQSIYRLRQVLAAKGSQEQPTLLVTRSTVQFNVNSDYSLDVTAFERYLENDELEEAVNLYRGELLPGFTCDSLPFEEWLRQERERLHRLVLDALAKLTNQCLAQADYEQAQILARQQVALEPWREEAHRQLMQALALLGERSAALAQYETCRSVLAEELGIEPAVETETLADHIRDMQPKQTAQHAPGRSLERRPMTMPFVGRSREYEAVVRAFERAVRDGIQVVTLVGEAGIGKTRLSQQFLDWAAIQGADVLRGRTFETSGRLSYQPLTNLLRQRLERENAPEDLLSDLWLTQLTRILPELRERYPDLPEPTQEEATARQHLFEAITRLGQALAERAPLVLFIDDWHWADAASLDVLHYAALRWAEERAPILVLLTMREEALSDVPELQSWLTRLKHNVAYVQLNLTELSREETEALIRVLLEPETGDGDAALLNADDLSPLSMFSRWLFTETDGQPLFLAETMKTLVEDGLVRQEMASAAWQVDWSKFDEQVAGASGNVLPGVREIIQGWLGRISAPAGELLTAAAVLDQNASFDYLCRLTGLDEKQAMAAIDELLSRQLLLEADEGLPALGRDPIYRFSHQKVSEVVYAEAGAARRRFLHRRAFEVLQARAAPAAELAYHALNAGLVAETIQYSLAAGNEAMDIFAAGVAITHYETAWQVTEQKGWPEEISGADRQALYTGLGRAYELTEAWPQAQEIYEALIAYAQAIGAPAMECLGLNRLANIYIITRNRPQAIAVLEQARSVAREHGDQRGLAESELNLLLDAHLAGDANSALRHGEQALGIARQLAHPQLLARCLNLLSYVHFQLRRWDVAEVYAAEARQHYTALGNQVLAADSQRMIGIDLMFCGRPQEGLATLEETFAFSRNIENLWGQADCAWKLAFTHLELGHLDQAISLSRQGVRQARQVGAGGLDMMAQTTWGTVQRALMALEPARETLEALLAKSTEQLLASVIDWILAELCAVHALAGNWEQATDYARQNVRFLQERSTLSMGLTGWYETEALLRGGHGDLARTEVERLGEIVGNNRRCGLPLLRSQAVLAQWDGDLEQAIAHLQAALTLAQEIGLPGEAWSILGALGTLYGNQGDVVRAQEARKASATIIRQLAETIDEDNLRAGFLAAVPVQSILKPSE